MTHLNRFLLHLRHHPSSLSQRRFDIVIPSSFQRMGMAVERRRHSDFFAGRPLRFVEAKSSSSFSVMDFSMLFEAPFKLDFFVSPLLAASAAPAAFCWAFDLAGMSCLP
ncbi:hypothetical protein AGR2A_Cc110230 [Agrobacterium genomosp. 2 str. CFBP 5494]|uniref:Uncharacterized protein n=1 Tax=Agrobacterium genomosp. 2 str. CFBP 5494 TaxID=1183436 RepID=A0A9W5AYL7_9HYPH|nr:hypothetical protein AGR2A_Cc110230 [Agrobacterium genomosp. 2 str. CFBP 5494]